MSTLISHTTNTIAEIGQDIGIIYLKERFFSEDDSGDLHIQIGNKGTLGYRSKGGSNSLFGLTNTPEVKTLLWVKNEDFGIGKISTLNSLGYCIGSKGVVWIDLHTGEVHMKVLFDELNMGRIEKIDTIRNIGYGRSGVFKFRKDRKLTERIIGDTLASRVHSDIEPGQIEWKYTIEELGIGNIKEVFINYEGNIIIGTLGFSIINTEGNIILTNTYEQLGFIEIVQIYRNGWIVGENSALQIDFHTGNHVSPVRAMNIKDFITFSKNNKHSLMEESRWDDVVPNENPINTIEFEVSTGVKKITQ